MKTIFYALSLLAIGASGFFGWTAKQKFDAQIAERIEMTGKNEKLSKEITVKEKVKEDSSNARSVALDERASAEQGFKAAVSKAGELARTLSDVGSELEEAVAKEADVTKTIASIREMFPGIELEQVPAKYQELVDREKKLDTEKGDLELFKQKLTEEIAKTRGEVARVRGNINEGMNRVMNNNFQATITSVDNEWNFVIIGAGEKAGLVNGTTLLVSRGGTLIGKVKVDKVEASRSVGDIDAKSLRPGVVIQRGDQVVLETVKAN